MGREVVIVLVHVVKPVNKNTTTVSLIAHTEIKINLPDSLFVLVGWEVVGCDDVEVGDDVADAGVPGG